MPRMPVESLVDRRYRHDLAEWAAWRQHQARLRRLASRALDTLEETLDAGGADAMKAAALVLRMTATAQAPQAPYRHSLEMTDAAELAAGITSVGTENTANAER